MQSEFIVNILLVDDHPENLLSLEAILEPLSANLVRSNSGEEALRVLLEQDFALILLDVQMPGMDGFETASLIRKRRRSRQTPIIFLTAFSTNPQMLTKGYSLGAVDYLHKPIDPVILLSKATVFVDLFKKTQAIQQQSRILEQQANQLAAANAQLRQSEEQFRLLSQGSPIGIFLTDPQGNLTYTNPQFEAICGFSAPAPLPAELLKAIDSADRERLGQAWATYTTGQRELSDDFRLESRLESSDPASQPHRWVNLRSRPLFSDRHELLGHLGTIEDISERKQAEAIRAEMIREQAARQEAEATNRMKDEFLAVLSHELRTPLNAMMGWSKILSDSFARQGDRRLDEATFLRGLGIIQRNAQAQTQLIEDLLDVSRIIQGKLTLSADPVLLAPVIEAAIESVRPQAEAKNIRLIAHAIPSDITVEGDAVRLQQIVWNLVSNAIKFTPDGGQVEVKLERDESSVLNDELRNPAAQNSKFQTQNSQTQNSQTHAHITITDTGIGIAPEFLPYVFDRFKQADSTTTRSYSGLGLGLAIVRSLVELHRGTVQAESAGVGQGAVFTVTLPTVARGVAGEQGGGGAGEQGSYRSGEMADLFDPATLPLSTLTILVVDDEKDARDLLSYLLEKQGAAVTAAASAEQALQALKKGSFDLLISDISMPEVDGYELLGRVRSLRNDQNDDQNKDSPKAFVLALALTAHAGESDRARAFAAGFQAHLAKPIQPEKLLEAIGDLLKRDAVSPPGNEQKKGAKGDL